MDKEGSHVDLKRKFADVVEQTKRFKAKSEAKNHSNLEQEILLKLEAGVKQFKPSTIKKESKREGFLLCQATASYPVFMSDTEKVREYKLWYRDTMKKKVEALIGDADALRFKFTPFLSKHMIIKCYIKRDNGYVPGFCDSDYEEKEE